MATADEWKQEMEWEEQMIAAGAKRYNDNLQKQRGKGKEASTLGATRLLQVAYRPAVEQVIKDRHEDAPKRRISHGRKLIRDLEPEVIAYLGVSAILEKLAMTRASGNGSKSSPGLVSATSMYMAVGRAFLTEMKSRYMRKQNPREYDYHTSMYVKSYNKEQSLKHLRTLEEGYEPLSRKDQAHIGMAVVDLVRASVPIIEVTKYMSKKGRVTNAYSLSPEFKALLHECHDSCSLIRPKYMPTLIEPQPWTNLYDGGYHNADLPSISLVKTSNKEYLRRLEEADLSRVYAAVNAVQRVPWRINTWVLDTLNEVRKTPLAVEAKLPAAEDRPLPDWDESADKTDQMAARCLIHRENSREASRYLALAAACNTANDLRDQDRFYFPHTIDTRGRVYPVTAHLSPQGTKYCKALLEFAESEPLGTPEAARWLKIHTANCWGLDKAPMSERVEWVDANTDMFYSVANDPMEDLRWMDADDPWGFLAAVAEMIGYLEEGLKWESRLPIAMDGSNNGLQHASAMLRDYTGGHSVNLVPCDEPMDVYADVLDRLKARVTADIGKTDSYTRLSLKKDYKLTEGECADLWLNDIGLDRDTVKRPTMTTPYGVTFMGIKDHVETLAKQHATKHGKPKQFKHQVAQGLFCDYLTHHIVGAIDEVVQASNTLKEWIQAAVKEIPNEVYWTVPTGFPVCQHYYKQGQELVASHFKRDGNTIQMKCHILHDNPDEANKTRHRNGISPNYIHSFDAACLMETVLVLEDLGITSHAWVHDSYATHASNCEALAEGLRKVFCDIYERDNLQILADELQAQLPEGEEVPNLPEYGGLDVSKVVDSTYFFH